MNNIDKTMKFDIALSRLSLGSHKCQSSLQAKT